MKKTTAYVLTDGRIITDKKEARTLQKEIDIKLRLEGLIRSNLFVDDVDEAVETIYNLRESFINALNNK